MRNVYWDTEMQKNNKQKSDGRDGRQIPKQLKKKDYYNEEERENVKRKRSLEFLVDIVSRLK